MKIKLEQIVSDEVNLVELQKIELPIKISYWVKRVADKCAVELKRFRDVNNDLVIKLGKEDKDKKGSFKIEKDSKNFKEYTKQLTELLELEIDLEGINPIKISELGDIKASSNQLVSWLFVD